jgi:hypothetical protein
LEAIMLVCDYGDGRTAVEQVTLSVRGRRLVVDLCEQHLGELTKNARAPRPGRRRKAAAPVAKRRGRPPGSRNKATAKNGRRKATPKRITAKKATRTTRARARRRTTKPAQAK